MEFYDIAIIGTGPAGISSALTAKIRNKKILLIGQDGISPKVKNTELVRNFPGLPDIKGADFAAAFEKQLKSMDIEITDDRINCIYAMGSKFSLKGTASDYEASAVIVATGVDFGKPIKGEKDFIGRGVSYCATCDGMFYKEKSIIVIAFDDECFDEIKFLSELCSEIKVCRMFEGDFSRQLPENVSFLDGKVKVIFGNLKAQGIVTDKNEPLDCDGIFIFRKAIRPESLVPGLKVEDNHISVDRSMKTNIAGCFACGDVTGAPYQYIKAAGEGNVAALSAVSYLESLKK